MKNISSLEGLSSYTVSMLRKNEQRMNYIKTIVFIGLDAAMMVHATLNHFRQSVWMFFGLPMVLMTAIIIVNICTRKKVLPILKYINSGVMLLSVLIVSMARDDFFLILFVFPPIFSVFYYNPRYTVITSAFSLILTQFVMLNSPDFTQQELSEMTLSDLPLYAARVFDFSQLSSAIFWKYRVASMFILIIVLGVGIYMSFSGKRFYCTQAEVIRKNTSNDIELDLARKIQKGFLDDNFPDNESYAVFADMTPASQVGGDFYDFFLTDETHLAMVIGDVSGHGTGAAMFMTLTKTLIKVYAQAGMTPDKVFEHTGRYLVQSNPQKFFVTCWMGILDLSNGQLSFSNAGHNYPVIICSGKEPEFIKTKPRFVLGRKRLVSYIEEHLRLTPGDRIVLYTDGVTEAQSPEGELFGDERLIEVLKSSGNNKGSDPVRAVRAELDRFEQGREHFDDETMLALTFKDYLDEVPMESRVFSLNKQTFDVVMEHIRERCIAAGCGEQAVSQISIASSEILANIDSYAYTDGGQVEILTRSRDRRMTIVFKDGGRPFDPLGAKTPDVTVPISERKPGGLGIFIVKKLMSDVSYKYDEGQNVLTIEKEF